MLLIRVSFMGKRVNLAAVLVLFSCQPWRLDRTIIPVKVKLPEGYQWSL